ncbi:MAG TPA: hypothetical protein VF039_10830 [Longimicrobiales bacterium]
MHTSESRAEKPNVIGRADGTSGRDPVSGRSVAFHFDRHGQVAALDTLSSAWRVAVTSTFPFELATAFLVARQPELDDGHAPAQPSRRLASPEIEHAMAPAECGVLVDVDDRAGGSHGQPTVHAPEEGAPALRPLQVMERRPGEGAERAAAVATSESLATGEAAPLLGARTATARAARSVA